MSEPGTVVLIDGSERREAIADSLAGAGFDVTPVGDIPAATERLSAGTVDCVVSTFQVPRRDGLEFLGGFHALEAVAERDPDIPRILYAEVVNPDIAREAVSLGLFDFIAADTDGSEGRLVSRVREAVAKRRAERTIADLSRVNEVIREVLTVVVRAESQGEVWREVTTTLVATDAYDSAWVGRIDDGVETLAAAGDEAGTDEAAVAAVVEEPTGGDVDCPAALARADAPDWQPVVVPITEDGTVLVLWTVRPSGLGERERAVLAQLGETIRYASDAIAARETLADREQALAEKSERLSEFANVVSHDIRNPLSVAAGNLELALEGDLDRLEKVDAALDRLDDIVDDVLTLAREGEKSLTPNPVSLSSVAEAAWQTAGIEGATFTPPAEAVVRADHGQLTRLFENLFRNSVDHGPEADALEVGVDCLPSGFAVFDNGPGVPEADRTDLFEAGVTTAAEGTGFGLAIVSDIADAHGWSVTVTESETGGARFEVTGVEFEAHPTDGSA